jgi:hypothetical protein
MVVRFKSKIIGSVLQDVKEFSTVDWARLDLPDDNVGDEIVGSIGDPEWTGVVALIRANTLEAQLKDAKGPGVADGVASEDRRYYHG